MSSPVPIPVPPHAVYDKNGIPILPGDTLKVFHYIAAKRNERRFMYQYAEAVEEHPAGHAFLRVSHLNLRKETCSILLTGQVLRDYEVVQGFGSDGTAFRDRPKASFPRPKDGHELMAMLAAGMTVEIPTAQVMKSLAWLESRCGNFAIHVEPHGKGRHTLTPESSTAVTFRRLLENPPVAATPPG